MRGRTAILACVLSAAFVGLTVTPMAAIAQEDSSPADISIERAEYEVTISDDGEIEHYTYRYLMNDESYDEFQSLAEEQGYESPAELFAANAETLFRLQQLSVERETAAVNEVDGKQQVEIVLDTGGLQTNETTVEDGTVTLEGHPVLHNDQFDEQVAIIDMPGEITDSNADAVDGNVATWRMHDNMPETQFVEAEIASDATTEGDADGNESDGDDEESDESEPDDESNESDGNDEESDNGDGEMPGFGLTATVAAVIGAVLLFGYRRPS